jgi:hypothetical protein
MGMKRRRRFMFQSEGLETATFSLKGNERAELEDAARDINQFLTVVLTEEQIHYSVSEIEALHEKLANASEIIERLALTAWEHRREFGLMQNSIDEDEEV